MAFSSILFGLRRSLLCMAVASSGCGLQPDIGFHCPNRMWVHVGVEDGHDSHGFHCDCSELIMALNYYFNGYDRCYYRRLNICSLRVLPL